MKKKLLFVIAILISVNCISQNPTWEWAVGVGGTGGDEGTSIATDAAGNVYTTGMFSNQSITFGSFTLYNSGIRSGFLVKQDNSGNIIWAKGIYGSYGLITCSGICTDKNGFIYLTGSFESNVTFNTTTLNTSGTNLFLVKFDGSGNVIWAKNAPGNTCILSLAVCTDKVGYEYITGYFYTSTISFGSNVITNISAAGQPDGFVVKYDSSGNVVWANGLNGVCSEIPNDISSDPAGNVNVIGNYTSPTLNIGDTVLTNSVIDHSNFDFFIARFDSKGNFVWAKTLGSIVNDEGTGICVSLDGNIYATGTFAGYSTTFDSINLTGNNSCANTFIVKIDTSSNIIWAKSFGNQPNNYGIKITADAFNNAYITGKLSSYLTIGSSVLTGAVTDIYIAKFNAAGNAISGQGAGGSSFEEVTDISIDAHNNCFVTGYFYSPTVSFGNIILTNDSTPNTDIYIAKLAFPLGIEVSGNPNFNANIFPNPFASKAIIRFNKEQNNATIRIIDIMGKEVRVSHFNGKQYVIEKGDMQPGVYIVQISDEKQNVINKKIIVQ
jgi:hypothetical protein